jgi:SAM-dependent methyltransferase
MLRRSLMRSALVLAAVLALTATGTVAQPLTPLEKKLDVPYVPTHERIVNEMLKIANVGKNDVLYDLGCGDGRIPITAAKRFGTRGVGVDIDPQRVTEARENAVKEGVTDRVKFFQQDLFDTDIKDATVVTLYLLPDINLRLRPRLLSDLKPGTRVVSHNYDMGDWQPQRTITIKLPDGEHTVYFWVVPPRGAGK